MKLTSLFLVLVGFAVGTGIGLFVGKSMYDNDGSVSEKVSTVFEKKSSKSSSIKVQENLKSDTERIKKKAKKEVEKTLKEIDLNARSAIPDTLPLDSTIPVPKKIDELDTSSYSQRLSQDTPILILTDEITVRSETLLGEAFAEIIWMGSEHKSSDSITAQDSVLQKVADIKKINPKKYKIQFWESPINYSGYKMANNNVIIYGLDPTSSVRVINYGNRFYLDYQGTYYNLTETYDYKPLSKLSDKHLILLFNESGN